MTKKFRSSQIYEIMKNNNNLEILNSIITTKGAKKMAAQKMILESLTLALLIAGTTQAREVIDLALNWKYMLK